MEKEKYKIELRINGVVGSPGISIGKACVMKKKESASTGILLKNEDDVIHEIEKFKMAVQKSVDDLHVIKNDKALNLSHEDIEILETHIEFLTDPQIKADVHLEITSNRRNVIDAVIDVISRTAHDFKNMDNEYLRARSADVQDIGDRILQNLSYSADKIQQKFQQDTIIIAQDISPSSTITFDLRLVIGFATQAGGRTSHTAILAKSRNIPAVLGCGNILSSIDDNDVVIVDATEGLVIVNPSDKTVEDYKVKKKSYDQHQKFLGSLKDKPAQTTDGITIELLANISDADDLEDSKTYGAEGAGLFRTELLFMNRSSFPLEEEQYEFYKKVALRSKGKPVIIRTIDIGGDKPLDYFKLPKEENPFLGYRGIRICLDRRDIFVTQLKAILRASVFGNFRIMFPMISNIHELRLAKEILEETKGMLQENSIAFDKAIQVGMMIEVPSAAITSDILAREVDFFSIGTNDLCQYTLAVDRGNGKVNDLYDPFDPAVLRLIGYVIEQAHKRKVSVGMCGELASDPRATLLLVGMGLKEFSMSATAIPSVKSVILNNSYSKAKEVYGKVLGMDNSKSIVNYLALQK